MSNPTPEHDLILANLNRIRRRLFAVRLAERLAVTLIWAALIALFVVASRLLHPRYPLASNTLMLFPLAAAAWLLITSLRGRPVLPQNVESALPPRLILHA